MCACACGGGPQATFHQNQPLKAVVGAPCLLHLVTRPHCTLQYSFCAFTEARGCDSSNLQLPWRASSTLMERSAVTMARAEGACGRLLAPRSGGAIGQRRRAMQQRRRAPVAPRAGLLGDIFDFESWAPRSSRAWRLGQNVNARPGAIPARRYLMHLLLRAHC